MVARGTVQLNSTEARFDVRFRVPFPQALKDRVKAIAGTRWDPVSKRWQVPEWQAAALLEALSGHAFQLDDASRERFEAAAHAMSRDLGVASDADTKMPSASAASPIVREAVAYRARQEAQGTQESLFFDSNASGHENDAPSTIRHDLPAEEQEPLRIVPTSRTEQESQTQPMYPSVLHLMQRAKMTLQKAFEQEQWVVGIVQDLTFSRRGHLYFRLVDTHPDIGPDQAILNVAAFGNSAQQILQALADHHLSLQEGMTVALCGQVTVYAPRSQLQLIAHRVDVRVSRGEVELQRDRVIEELRKAQLIGVNETVSMPLLPQRIVVLTSAHGDAIHDVLRTLRRGEVGAQLSLIDVPVQGPELAARVIAALAQVETRRAEFDLVLIVRGGGAANELAWWDDFAIGQAIATLSLPVILGIGHERDVTALHMVARFEATPTAVAQFVVDHWALARAHHAQQRARVCQGAARVHLHASDRLMRVSHAFSMGVQRPLMEAHWQVHTLLPQRLKTGVRAIVQDASQHHETNRKRLQLSMLRAVNRAAQQLEILQDGTRTAAMEHGITGEQQRLLEAHRQLVHRVTTRLRSAEREHDMFARTVRVLDPERQLARGYALVRNAQGRIVRSADAVTVGDALELQLSDGMIGAVVRTQNASAQTVQEDAVAQTHEPST